MMPMYILSRLTNNCVFVFDINSSQRDGLAPVQGVLVLHGDPGGQVRTLIELTVDNSVPLLLRRGKGGLAQHAILPNAPRQIIDEQEAAAHGDPHLVISATRRVAHEHGWRIEDARENRRPIVLLPLAVRQGGASGQDNAKLSQCVGDFGYVLVQPLAIHRQQILRRWATEHERQLVVALEPSCVADGSGDVTDNHGRVRVELHVLVCVVRRRVGQSHGGQLGWIEMDTITDECLGLVELEAQVETVALASALWLRALQMRRHHTAGADEGVDAGQISLKTDCLGDCLSRDGLVDGELVQAEPPGVVHVVKQHVLEASDTNKRPKLVPECAVEVDGSVEYGRSRHIVGPHGLLDIDGQGGSGTERGANDLRPAEPVVGSVTIHDCHDDGVVCLLEKAQRRV